MSSTSTRPSSVGSTSMSPLGMRRSSVTGPAVSNVLCIWLLLALGIARQALAGDVCLGGTRLGRACDRADEPRVGGDALAGSGPLDRVLQRVGKAQRDARRQLLAGHARLAGGLDVDELRLLPGEPDLDVPVRQLRGELDRGLREDVEELE